MNPLLGVSLVAVAAPILCSGGGLQPPLTFEQRSAESFAARVAGQRFIFGLSGQVTGQNGLPVLQFAGTRSHVRPRVDGPAAGTFSYFAGRSPREWRTGIPLYNELRYSDLYPGVDLVYYGNPARLEYDLVVAPGASWEQIRLIFSRGQQVTLGPSGELHSLSESKEIVQSRPSIYQLIGDRQVQVFGRYRFIGAQEIGLAIGPYDTNLPLIIDPTLSYSSYLGGAGAEYAHAVAVDSAGCAYVVGETGSADFPSQGAEQGSLAGNSDVFVTKWNAAGTGVVYSTYIGGSGRDVALGVAVDSAGNAYITGFTYSGDFPITSGALRTSFTGQSKAFIVKLNSSGAKLTYATYLGGSGDDYGDGIAVDASGQVFVAGYTSSLDFLVTANAFQRYYGGGAYDGFLAKANSAGAALVYATYLGGRGNDTAAGVALDPSGNIYVTGQTQSTNFPTLNPLQATSDESDAFVVKLNGSGQAMYSTYLGGTGLNNGTGIAADAAGSAYVTGFTNAANFPGAGNTINGGYDGFIAKLNSYGSSVTAATYVGGSASDVSYSIALDASGDVFIAGSTLSMDLPVKAAIQPAYLGGGDAFVAAFNNQLTAPLYSTYFGGSGSDVAASIAVDSSGNAYIAGWTNSGVYATGLPVTPGSFAPGGRGGEDAFVAKLALAGSSLACATSVPNIVTVQAGSSAQQVGDLVLSCTGGISGATVSADIQAALSTHVAGTSPAELFIGTSTNPVWGAANDNAVLFSGVSFQAPGPSSSITLRISNVWADVSTLALGAPVAMTVAVYNATTPLTVTPAQQIVATVQQALTPQLQQFVLSKSAAPAGCGAPPAASSFLVSDAQAVAWASVANVAAGDAARFDWISPAGTKYQSHSVVVSSAGTQCASDSMSISRAPISMPGAWSVNLYWNNVLLGTAPFTVATTGVKQLIWQNTTTRQTNANYYGGAGGAVMIGWACLNCNSGLNGWRVAGMGDFDRNGVPDLVWQNQTTGQVNVNYYGGAGGTSITGFAVLNSGSGTAGWSVVAVADMNGDGIPDLIWQNSATGQVNVNYYSGATGATLSGFAVLNNGAGTSGWHVVAAADFDRNGMPDLVWQNRTSGQVNVNYYSGAGGSAITGWAILNSGAETAGWQVVAAADIDGNGVPDLIWQNGATGQVNVNYYSGSLGSVLSGFAVLNSGAGTSGWQVVTAR